MNKNVEHFDNELDRLIERFREEYDISYAEVVGTLAMKIHHLCNEADDDPTP